MYRLLIADDEGIMLESFTEIIRKQFEDRITVSTAKSGRAAIEQAESFHPDIIFMDIRMPGINGIQAIREIRSFNSTALFYILSAYDEFDYAKEAISLGVSKYLMKPVSRQTIIDTVTEAIAEVDRLRSQRSDQLRIQEKLQTVLPVVESGFVSDMVMSDRVTDGNSYLQLLDITEKYAYACLIRFGQSGEDGRLISTVRSGVEGQDHYAVMRDIIKSYVRCIVGPVMSNQFLVVVPTQKNQIEYERRIEIIEQTRKILTKLEEKTQLKFKAGISRVNRFQDLKVSYQEAQAALENSKARVTHIEDAVTSGVYEDDYPIEAERDMFAKLSAGDVEGMQAAADLYFSWILQHDPNDLNSMRLKALELVMRAEFDAFNAGSINYAYNDRKDYLTQINGLISPTEVRTWFFLHMTQIASGIRDRADEQSESIVQKAQKYMRENYMKEISLDDVSKEVNVSPYYFSKLFKEEVGENFIEYLTKIRIGKAKEMLAKSSESVKEIGLASGYADSNYFSRIFKKQTGMTPSEYRDHLRADGS